MITLQGMAEHRFSNVYNYQCHNCLASRKIQNIKMLILFLTGFYAKSSIRRQHFEKINKGSLAPLYKCKFVYWQKEKRKIGKFTAKLTVIKSQHLCKGMAWLPFQKYTISIVYYKYFESSHGGLDPKRYYPVHRGLE